MTDKNWSEKISEMERNRLEHFAINAIGTLMSLPGFTDKTPDEVFRYIFEIGEEQDD